MTDHLLCLEFAADGQVHFTPHTDDPAELARRFARIVRVLVEHPSAIKCAAGYHPNAPEEHQCRAHTTEPPR